jgi:teichuronic acid biosynthesis glycosyltransferase TuaG
MKKISVSAIMPYYKKKLFFKEALNSYYNQRLKNKELIIVYDDDDKVELQYIKKIIKNFKNIKLLINKKNIGAGRSRNKAAKIARGKYLAFLDADDIWKTNKTNLQLNFMKNNNLQISHTSYSIINENKNIIGHREAKYCQTYQNLLNSCDIGLSSVIIEKNLFLKNQFSKNKTKEDYAAWLKISKKMNIYGLKKNLLLWRKTKNSLSANITQKLKDAIDIYYNKQKFNIFQSIYRVIKLSFNFLIKKYL